MQNVVSVILCGGEGRRLAPFSTPDFPKQFLGIHSQETLFSMAVSRAENISPGRSVIVSLQKYLDIISAQSASHNHDIILEPAAKNTAPAIALAALYIARKFPGSVMCVLPSDHIINNQEKLKAAIDEAVPSALAGKIVTFGIAPATASNQYGYIVTENTGSVREFIEKPDTGRAQALLDSGNCFWNSGIFLFTPETILAEMEKFLPGHLQIITKAFYKGTILNNCFTPQEKIFNSLAPAQIDKYIMQKTDQLVVKPVDIDWVDLGNIDLLWQYSRHNAGGIPFIHKKSTSLSLNINALLATTC